MTASQERKAVLEAEIQTIMPKLGAFQLLATVGAFRDETKQLIALVIASYQRRVNHLMDEIGAIDALLLDGYESPFDFHPPPEVIGDVQHLLEELQRVLPVLTVPSEATSVAITADPAEPRTA